MSPRSETRYKTRDDYREAWSAAAEQTPPVPLNIDIELASICNLSCPFCFISDGSFDEMITSPSDDGKSRRRLMPTKMALRIVEQSAVVGVPALKFNWRGESTLHPDYSSILVAARAMCGYHKSPHLPDDLDYGPYCKPAFFDILVNTNANCQDRAIDGLMAATKVMVSLDSLVPGTYAIMRRRGNLERAKGVIYELIRRRHPNLWIRRVLTNENKSEPFYDQVREAFGRSVHVSEHFCIDRNAVSNYETAECRHDLLPRTYCKYPSQRIVIASTGLCYPCCIDLHETMPIGDIRKQSLLDIWRGEAMQRLRLGLKGDHPSQWSETCRKCESWMSYDVPERKFVQDRELTDETPTIVGLVAA